MTLNGTSSNPWHRYGLTVNPFPQIGKAELDAGERLVASLDGDPIVDAADIRRRLRGCSKEFVEGCIERFVPGERVRFTIEWEDESS